MTSNLIDRIRGMFFGYAIGDTLGKGTEFMTAEQASTHYPGGLRNYSQIIRDVHRSQWDRRDFTLDTEIILRLGSCIVEHGDFKKEDFAKVLKDWYDETPYDFNKHIRVVMAQEDFLADPLAASERCWKHDLSGEAYNEALGRCMLIGCAKNDMRKKMIDNCRMTHYAPMCVCTGRIIAEIVNSLVWGSSVPDVDTLVGISDLLDKRATPYVRIAHDGTLEELELDDPETYWYASKTMAAALWTFWHITDPEEALYRLVDCGGDANSNAALALGLLGLKHGVDAMPGALKDDLLQHDRIDRVATDFTKFLKTL